MRVLVTGGAGLVGTECCRLFSEKGYEVRQCFPRYTKFLRISLIKLY